MKNFLKQLFCNHDIVVKTESHSPEHVFIVKSIIECTKCQKTFAQHPNAQCCYVLHIHSKIMQDHWINIYKAMQQPQQ